MTRVRVGLLGLAFLVLAFFAFGPALTAPFDFDDGPAIVGNLTIRQLWPISVPLRTPPSGTAVSGRPVANVSFALNYVLNRWLGIAQTPVLDAPDQTIGYHIVNVLLHVLAALLLFAVVRRTLREGRLPGDWPPAADRVALIVAGIWLVHPIQTEAVDYVSQRTELLVSVCYLATVYASIRAWGERSRASVRWSVVAVIAGLAGMGSKEVMLSVPLIVPLYDRAFLAKGWGELWAIPSRRRLYVALAATSTVSIGLIAAGARSTTVGFHLGLPWYEYLYSQAWAILHYVKLILWPGDLTIDYGQSPVRGVLGIPGLIGLAAFAAVTVIAWRHDAWQWLGFLGAWFFLLLAPSSSVVPISTEIAAERRIYLASAALITLAVVGAETLWRRASRPMRSRTFAALALVGLAYFIVSAATASRIASNDVVSELAMRGGIAVAAVALAWCVLFAPARARTAGGLVLTALLVGATSRRSSTYLDAEALWRDAVAKAPNNARAYDNLAAAELRETPPRLASADSMLRRAVGLDSTYVPAWVRSAAIAVKQSRLEDAEALLGHALRVSPFDSAATEAMGKVLLAQGEGERALPYLRKTPVFSPGAESFGDLGQAYLGAGQLDSAVLVLRRVLDMAPANIEALRYLGGALIEQQRGTDAIPYLTRAVQRDPDSGFTLALLSVAFAQSGQGDLAARSAEVAVARAPMEEAVYVFAGRAMQTAGRPADAVIYLDRAVRLAPNDPQALARLGIAAASLGRTEDAERLFARALVVGPGYPLATRSLEELRHRRGR